MCTCLKRGGKKHRRKKAVKKAPADSCAVCQCDPPAFAESQPGFNYHHVPVSVKQFVKTNQLILIATGFSSKV